MKAFGLFLRKIGYYMMLIGILLTAGGVVPIGGGSPAFSDVTIFWILAAAGFVIWLVGKAATSAADETNKNP